MTERRWRTVQRPHNAQRSFDWATCLCGWQDGGDDYDALDVAVKAHNAAHAGQMVTVQVSP